MIRISQHAEELQTMWGIHWFGLRVKQRSEFRACGELSLRGFEAFLPSQRVRRRWSDRTQVVEEPLFPGYLFCRFERSDRIRILETPGVIQVVGFGERLAPIDEAEIDAIQRMVASRVELTPWPYLGAGQQIVIDAGPLAGVRGVVIRTETGNPRVVVSVTLMQRSITAEIDREWIDVH
jgi:transcription antitermination factor NusG